MSLPGGGWSRQFLDNPAEALRIVERAAACLVTESEHRRLGAVDDELEGWDRYRAAGIEVFDMRNGERAETEASSSRSRPPKRLHSVEGVTHRPGIGCRDLMPVS
jgi:hypothetical protein